MNKLYYGDNLDVLRRFIRDETVDLCYIDPPFNSKRNYNQIYNNIGREDVAQAQAFIDTWTWNDHANECLAEILSNKNGVQTAQSTVLIQGLENVLGKGSLFAYIVNMTVRIAEIRRTLKFTGSFYLHCDSTASHYLKIICDALFCGDRGGQFLNEITWKRKTGRGETNHKSNRFGNSTDTILFYSKSSNNIFNSQYNMSADGYSEYVEKFFRFKDETGRVYRIADLSSPSPRPNLKYDYKGYKPPANGWAISREKMELWDKEGRLHFPKDPNGRIQRKRFLNELKGKPIQNLWDDIEMISSQSAERLGYPTQKPEALLERIINASSNEGDTILDAFCGCGTSIAVAQRLSRRWIGIDITYQSISLIMKRLKKIENAAELVEMHGIPRDMESVEALVHKKDDRVRKEFEKWAVLTFSDNQAIINEKKGADKGVDGVAYTITGRDEKGNLTSKPVIFSVKSGHVNSSVIRDLHGTIEREKAAAGFLITLEEPTKPMINEAKQAGQFKGDFATFDRLQIVTVKEILDNKRMNLPLYAEMIKQAQSDSGANQPGLYE